MTSWAVWPAGIRYSRSQFLPVGENVIAFIDATFWFPVSLWPSGKRLTLNFMTSRIYFGSQGLFRAAPGRCPVSDIGLLLGFIRHDVMILSLSLPISKVSSLSPSSRSRSSTNSRNFFIADDVHPLPVTEVRVPEHQAQSAADGLSGRSWPWRCTAASPPPRSRSALPALPEQ